MNAALPDVLSIHRSFSEKARRAASWALDFVSSHSLEPQPVVAHLSALLQALGSALAYSDDTELALKLAQALHQPVVRAGMWGEWEPYVDEALALARQAGDRLAVFHLLYAMGDVRALRGDWLAALQPLQDAVELSRLVGENWHLPFTRAAECLMHTGRPMEAQALLARARRRARQLGDSQAQIIILALFGQARIPTNGWRAALSYFETALNLARQAENTAQVMVNLNLLGSAYRELGRLGQARNCLDEALALSRRLGERSMEGMVLSNLGALYMASGDLETAQVALGTALSIHRSLGHPAKTALILINMGCLGVQRNELTSAGGYLAEAVQIASAVPYPPVLARACWATGDYYQASGEVAVASLAYARAKALFRQSGYIYHAEQVGQQSAISG